MAKKISAITILVFFSITLLTAQSYTIHGTVTDEKGSPLPFVNIFLNTSKTGTITNYNGLFSLRFSGNSETMSVSFIGYETQTINVNKNTETVKIQMKSFSTQLDEFVVRGYSPEGLLREAIKKIPNNYPQEPFLIKAYNRHKLFETDTLCYMQEMAFHIVKSYRPSFTDEVFLIKNRNFRFASDRKRTLSGAGVFDIVKYSSNHFNSRFFRDNEIHYLPNTTFDNRPVYVLGYSRKNKENSSYGKIFIDVEDLAFVRFEDNPITGNKSTVQYKKIDNKYYLMSSNATYVNKRGSRIIPVESDFLVTDIILSFSREDIKGIHVNRDDVLEAYDTQDYDTLFWQQHSAILPDSTILEAIERHKAKQEFGRVNNPIVVKDTLQYQAQIKKSHTPIKRLYRRNLSLMGSSNLADDFSMLNHNLSSINRYVLHQLSYKFYKPIPKLLSLVTYNYIISAPIGDVASEWLLMNKNGIQAGMNPIIFNKYRGSYLYNIDSKTLSNFKNEKYHDFMRLHTIRHDGRYVKSFQIEEELAKVDIHNNNNSGNYLMLYWLELLGHQIANINNQSKKDVKQSNKAESRQPLIIDRNKSWVYYLFNPEMEYLRHIQQGILTDQEWNYLKRTSRWSWINLLSPQLFFIPKISIFDKHSFTFSINCLRVPFGEMFGQNIWFMQNYSQLHGVFFRQYRNYEKTTFGIGYKLYDVSLFRNMYMTSSIDYWQQPTDFDFRSTSSFGGFRVGQTFEYKLLQSPFSDQHKLSLMLGYDYKSKGYMPESFFMEKNFNVNIGFKWNF
jgi:hypothetical protein